MHEVNGFVHVKVSTAEKAMRSFLKQRAKDKSKRISDAIENNMKPSCFRLFCSPLTRKDAAKKLSKCKSGSIIPEIEWIRVRGRAWQEYAFQIINACKVSDGDTIALSIELAEFVHKWSNIPCTK
jgi:hypothetical protein